MLCKKNIFQNVSAGREGKKLKYVCIILLDE